MSNTGQSNTIGADAFMSIRLRKFIGVILFLITLLLYVLLAVEIEQIMPIDSNIYLQMVVYAVIGTFWVVPAAVVIWWMSQSSEK